MLLSSRRAKFQKQYSRKDVTKTVEAIPSFRLGYFGLYAEESGKVCSKQIEAIKLLLRRTFRRQAKVWVKLFPQSSTTKKPNETRLGKGKGNVKYWSYIARPGKNLVEIKGCKSELALQSLSKVKHKLSIKAMFRSKYHRWIL